MAKVCVYGS
ncbi:hypothetical protein ZEAMMB73_Zm00001d009054 [Zea mays]|uniref:Uncharacterized protein n=1 Tax=Zea mays TaxID=4577 RepID=A0A1D6FHK2_MAIZE|nr:hypothetical protein ZEAMMB73_Zm00001d009054 [Zea mays]